MRMYGPMQVPFNTLSSTGQLWTRNSCKISLLGKKTLVLARSERLHLNWLVLEDAWRGHVYTSWMWLTFQLTAQNIHQGVQSNYIPSTWQKGGVGICFPNHYVLCLQRAWYNSHILVTILLIYSNGLGSERPNTCILYGHSGFSLDIHRGFETRSEHQKIWALHWDRACVKFAINKVVCVMGLNCASEFNGKIFIAQDQQTYPIWNILKSYHITGVLIFLYFH